ncbi:hypothetical protein GW17_00014152 [Ensete ventricosum]|nr:hypothetical protein GW17_00014152 [Ensete ventricosum]
MDSPSQPHPTLLEPKAQSADGAHPATLTADAIWAKKKRYCKLFKQNIRRQINQPTNATISKISTAA